MNVKFTCAPVPVLVPVLCYGVLYVHVLRCLVCASTDTGLLSFCLVTLFSSVSNFPMFL